VKRAIKLDRRVLNIFSCLFVFIFLAGSVLAAPGYWTQSGDYLYPNDLNWNVGVGTDSPTAKLQVDGDIKTNQSLFVNTSTGRARLYLDSPDERASIYLISPTTQNSEIMFYNGDNYAGTTPLLAYGIRSQIVGGEPYFRIVNENYSSLLQFDEEGLATINNGIFTYNNVTANNIIEAGQKLIVGDGGNDYFSIDRVGSPVPAIRYVINGDNKDFLYLPSDEFWTFSGENVSDVNDLSAESVTLGSVIDCPLDADANGRLVCGTGFPGGTGGMDYTNIAMTNESNTFEEENAFLKALKINATNCNSIGTDPDGTLLCGSGGGSMDYTNVAMTNETNVFKVGDGPNYVYSTTTQGGDTWGFVGMESYVDWETIDNSGGGRKIIGAHAEGDNASNYSLSGGLTFRKSTEGTKDIALTFQDGPWLEGNMIEMTLYEPDNPVLNLQKGAYWTRLGVGQLLFSVKDDAGIIWQNESNRYLFTGGGLYSNGDVTIPNAYSLIGGVQVPADKIITLNENTTEIECDWTNAGSILYSANRHYGCDGTSWNPLY
jgi:hypothetical protein